MTKKGIKETLLSTLVHGEEVLNNIEVLRRTGKDDISKTPVNLAAIRLHPKQLNLVLNEVIDTKKGAKTLRFVSKDGYLPPFEAGQYINVFMEIDGCYVSRPYSLTSSPKQRGYYEITVENVKDGFVSPFLNNKAKVGDEFVAVGPAGHFTYNPCFHKKKSLFLAGGSSITPFISMIREILQSGQDRDVVLIYGSRTLKTAIYHEELLDYAARFNNFKYHLVLSEKDDKWDGDTGFLDEKIITKYAPDYLERTAYVCGPNVMHNFCKNELLKLGLKLKDIRDEMFGNPKDITKEPGWPEQLSGNEEFNINVEGKIIKAKASETILTALERNGIRINVCCRCGECSKCRVKLISGKVYLGKGILLRFTDEKFSYIHSCKSYPISDIEIKL